MPTKEETKKTPKQKGIKFLKVLLTVVIIIAVIAAFIAAANLICLKSSENFISSIKTVDTDGLTPELDSDGYYTFTTDKDFKVVQLTDVHIGAGFLSSKKDSMSINAVEAMVRAEKPDLVIVTGDIAFPVPYKAGTLNNKNPSKIFADLMEQMGVYWCVAFGNHDTETYSYYNREQIGDFYGNKEKYPHCLFQKGPEDVDGVGNYLIKVKNSKGEITNSFVMLDSGSYVDGDVFGILWKYDCVHKNQVDWYESQINLLTEENNGTVPPSLMFFHIPPLEMKDAYYAYKDNGFNDTDRVQYLYGKAGEKGAAICTSEYNYGLFDKVKELGSTKAVYMGHDHLNNFTLMYDGIQLSYGYSIDYLAYSGISKYGAQRGCNVITCKPDGTFTTELQNYYQDKYQSQHTKENVDMGDRFTEEEMQEAASENESKYHEQKEKNEQ